MADKITVTLAGTDFPITVPLTLGQLEDLEIAVVVPAADDPQEEMRRSQARGTGILLAALAGDNPDLTVEKLKAMRITRKERSEAIATILDVSGLAPKKDAAAGEAQAATA